MSDGLCVINGCLKFQANSRGWCVKHYQQWRRHSDPEAKDKKSPVCSIEGCEQKRLCRGYCNMHYQRYLKHGDPSISLMPVGRTPEQRFWEKVIKAENDQCWEWQAATDDDGYGIFGIEGCTAAKAHRVSYEWATGIKPGDLKVLHHCDNPPCVNPQHLYLGTPMDNMQDKIARGRAKYIHGEDHYGAKLTARQVRTIRRLRNNGSSFRELAKKYNVTASNIMKIVTRDSWKHI